MAAENQAAGKKGVLVWQQPKINHQRHFMLRLMQTPIPLVIVCMRAKYPMEQKGAIGRARSARAEAGRRHPVRDVRARLDRPGAQAARHEIHAARARQRHRDGEPISIDTGRRLAEWARGAATNWPGYYAWADEWLAYPTTWAVIPDVIDAGQEAQDALLGEWPFGDRGAPVWHMDEPVERLLALCDGWSRVCIGSTSVYADVLSDPWRRRMDEAFDGLAKRHHRLPWIHMLRGMACSGERWPFASVDSTDIGRNHNRPQNTPRKMADRWDAVQCPATWRVTAKQLELIA
jgi:hypothetical protein